MSKLNEKKQKAIAEALGSNRTFSVKKLNLGSPLSWLNLAHEIKGRLISTGGRPSDPYWDIKRLVPFRKKVWDYLSYESKIMSNKERKVGPAQLAAIIIENSLNQPIAEPSDFDMEFKIENSCEIFIQKHETNAISPRFLTQESSSETNQLLQVENHSMSSQWSKTEDPGNLMLSVESGGL